MIKRMATAAAVKLVREIIASGGELIFTSHSKDEMAVDGISLVEVRGVLKHGTIFMAPEQDIKSGEWKYRMEGSWAGRNIAVVFKFKTIGSAVVITVFATK